MKITIEFDDKTQTTLNPEALRVWNVQAKGMQAAAIGYKAGDTTVPVLFFPGVFFNNEELAAYTEKVQKEARNKPRNNKKGL